VSRTREDRAHQHKAQEESAKCHCRNQEADGPHDNLDHETRTCALKTREAPPCSVILVDRCGKPLIGNHSPKSRGSANGRAADLEISFSTAPATAGRLQCSTLTTMAMMDEAPYEWGHVTDDSGQSDVIGQGELEIERYAGSREG
jgi:hypothetical protein